MARNGHSWTTSAYDTRIDRREWTRLRKIVAARAGGRCERMLTATTRCPERGSECHHVGDNRDHSVENLAWLCIECHMRETQRQAQEAARQARDKLSHPASRSTRKPPGLL